MRSFSLKYGKYCKLNAQNLKSCKMKALTDLNFDQIENFVEYEAYHASSYFNSLLKQVLTLADFLENSGDFAKSYLDNMRD